MNGRFLVTKIKQLGDRVFLRKFSVKRILMRSFSFLKKVINKLLFNLNTRWIDVFTHDLSKKVP